MKISAIPTENAEKSPEESRKSLNKTILCVWQDHFIEVIGSQEFVLLPADEIAKLLASDDLNVSSEEIMFQVAI